MKVLNETIKIKKEKENKHTTETFFVKLRKLTNSQQDS